MECQHFASRRLRFYGKVCFQIRNNNISRISFIGKRHMLSSKVMKLSILLLSWRCNAINGALPTDLIKCQELIRSTHPHKQPIYGQYWGYGLRLKAGTMGATVASRVSRLSVTAQLLCKQSSSHIKYCSTQTTAVGSARVETPRWVLPNKKSNIKESSLQMSWRLHTKLNCAKFNGGWRILYWSSQRYIENWQLRLTIM